MSMQVQAFGVKAGHPLFELGMYRAAAGQTQDVALAGLLGDRFIARDRHDTNALVGAGYLLSGPERARVSIEYGINLFYLDQTRVTGFIQQELMFTNLAYSYQVTHFPVYAMAKALVKSPCEKIDFTVDAGIGPNFMNIHAYKEHALNDMTLPNNAFNGRSLTQLSEMVGVGLQINNFFGKVPFEVGYRFYNLGKGSLRPRTDQILNNLSTGNITAQALIATVRF
ncbi:MAG: hypothetical protein EPN84_08695 [Legionella sp.]|nr:MAG: hypothetical protein EPN84_08695 [Legionella sp.]